MKTVEHLWHKPADSSADLETFWAAAERKNMNVKHFILLFDHFKDMFSWTGQIKWVRKQRDNKEEKNIYTSMRKGFF